MNDICERIQEKDKVCINCLHFGIMEDRKLAKCKTCSNYHKDNAENNFEPDDTYLKLEFGCEACRYDDDEETNNICYECSRYYSDLWERGTE